MNWKESTRKSTTLAPQLNCRQEREDTTEKSKHIGGKGELNDQAYFLFMFSRLEDRINQLSNDLIDYQYNKLTNWSYKRTWDVLRKRKNQNPNSIYFMERVALLTEMGGADYNLIEKYYRQRNNIAHGQTFTIPINIPTVIAHMKQLHHGLK